MTMEEENKNCAFYYEICLLKLLEKMGLITKKECGGIVKIAAEDYNADVVLEPD